MNESISSKAEILKIISQSTPGTLKYYSARWEEAFYPRTEFGRRLSNFRKKFFESGESPLSAEEILAEVHRGRGGYEID